MEIKEAIKIIKGLIRTVEPGYNSSPLSKEGEHTATKALTLAISALEFRERYDNFWEEVKAAGMKGEETEIRHSGRVFRIREVAQ